MKEKIIRQRVQQIKDRIGDGRMEAAFEELQQFIAEIDGLEVEKAEERDLQNQLIAIRSRLNQIEKKQQLNPEADDTDFNIVLQSLLQLVDNVEKVAIDSPFINEDQAQTSAQLSDVQAVYTASIPIEKAQKMSSDGSENQGCMLAFANKSTNVNIEVKSFDFLKPILGLASVLLVIGAFFFMLPMMNKQSPQIGGGSPSPVVKPAPADSTTTPITKPNKLGKDAADIGFDPNSMEGQMADYLSDSNSPKSKRFSLDAAKFSKNRINLPAETHPQLDRIAQLLQEYPEAYLDIYGTLTEDEESAYRGNKEKTLDDFRAEQVHKYLKAKGIQSDQLYFEGEGISGKRGINFKLTK